MTQIGHYDQGDIWTPQATFTVNSVVTDPTTVTVKYKNPAGTITTVGPVSGATGGSGIVRVSQGVFNYPITLDDAGYWFCRFEGTGAATATEDHEAIVDPSEFYETAQLGARALVGLAETKDWLQQQNIDTSNDLDLARVINDVSDRIYEEADREFKVFGTNPQTRLFDADESAIMFGSVAVGDLTSFTTVQLQDRAGTVESTVAGTDIISLPRNRKPWEPVRQLKFTANVARLRADNVVSVAGTWGFPSVPGNIRQAALDAIAATIDRDVEHYRQDLSPAAAAAGTTTIVMAGGGQRMLTMPPAALAVVWGYREPWVA